MEKYKDMTIKKRANTKMIRNLVLFIFLIIFTFWFIFKDQSISELLVTIKSTNIVYILLGAVLMLLYFFIESYNIRNIVTSLNEKKLSIFKHLKFTLICFFFSAITPASTGGQPVEVYYMAKEDISATSGTIAMLLELSGYQISAVFCAIVMAIIYPGILKGGVIWFFLVGVIFNSAVILFMLLSVFSETATKKLVKHFIKLLKLFKTKNIDKKEQKILSQLEKYNESSNFIKSHKNIFIKSTLIAFVQIVCYFSITYCVYRAFGLNSESYFKVFAMQAILYTTVCCLPLPGSIGVSETLFLKIYGSIFSKSILSGAMLIYRVASFYLYIIISTIVVIINAIKTKNIMSEIDEDIEEIDSYDMNNYCKTETPVN